MFISVCKSGSRKINECTVECSRSRIKSNSIFVLLEVFVLRFRQTLLTFT